MQKFSILVVVNFFSECSLSINVGQGIFGWSGHSICGVIHVIAREHYFEYFLPREKILNTVTHLLNSQCRDVRTGTSRVILEVKGTSNGEVTS